MSSATFFSRDKPWYRDIWDSLTQPEPKLATPALAAIVIAISLGFCFQMLSVVHSNIEADSFGDWALWTGNMVVVSILLFGLALLQFWAVGWYAASLPVRFTIVGLLFVLQMYIFYRVPGAITKKLSDIENQFMPFYYPKDQQSEKIPKHFSEW